MHLFYFRTSFPSKKIFWLYSTKVWGQTMMSFCSFSWQIKAQHVYLNICPWWKIYSAKSQVTILHKNCGTHMSSGESQSHTVMYSLMLFDSSVLALSWPCACLLLSRTIFLKQTGIFITKDLEGVCTCDSLQIWNALFHFVASSTFFTFLLAWIPLGKQEIRAVAPRRILE